MSALTTRRNALVLPAAVAATLPMNLATLRTMNPTSVKVPGFGGIVPTSNYTIETWVNAPTAQNASLYSVNFLGANRLNVHYLYNGPANCYFDSGNISNGGRLVFAYPTAWLGANVHLALSVDATPGANAMRWYANGVLYASNAVFTPFTTVTSDLLIGDGAGRQAGKMGEFRLWNKVRSATEIQADMNNTINGPRPNLLACWRMDEGGTAVGTQILDRSGNAYHGLVY